MKLEIIYINSCDCHDVYLTRDGVRTCISAGEFIHGMDFVERLAQELDCYVVHRDQDETTEGYGG